MHVGFSELSVGRYREIPRQTGGHSLGEVNNVCYYVRFEVFMAVSMKNSVFGDVTPCGSCKNPCFGGTWRLYHQCDKNRWARNSVHRLLVTASVVPTHSCHPDCGGETFLRNVHSYKSHTV
jgi:hypothetical protein